MNEANWQVPVHFSDPSVVQLGNGESGSIDSPVRISHSFINYLNVPVVVVLRSGFRFELAPNPNMRKMALIARTEIFVTGTSVPSVERFLCSIGEHSTPELQAIRNSFAMQVENTFHGNAKVVLDYPIDYSVLQSHGGSVYYSELDMVVSILPLEQVVEHPYSQAGRDVAYANSLPVAVDGLDFNYAVSMVDNTGTKGPLYLNINNIVSKITPKRDLTRQDGIHVVSNHVSANGSGRTGVRVTRYPFDAAQELGLYKTYDEALSLGDLMAAQKREVLRLEGDLSKSKLEREAALIEQKRKHEEQVALLQKERLAAEEKARQTEEDAEKKRQKMKDEYEERSYYRKDSSEALKMLPSLVIGIGAVFLALNSFFGGRDSKKLGLLW